MSNKRLTLTICLSQKAKHYPVKKYSLYVYVNSQNTYHEQRKRNLDFSVEEVNGVKVCLAVRVFETLADFL